jgi:hypothetical protein
VRDKLAYTLTVGEAGNNIGHPVTSLHVSDKAAIRKAKRLAADYGGDGWWTVHLGGGLPVANGGVA